MRPVYVRTLEDLRSAVTLNSTTESLFVEFKVDLDRTKDDWQVEVAQDITQFANTLGGCLLIGIAESKDRKTRVKVAAAFAGVQDPGDHTESCSQYAHARRCHGDRRRANDCCGQRPAQSRARVCVASNAR